MVTIDLVLSLAAQIAELEARVGNLEEPFRPLVGDEWTAHYNKIFNSQPDEQEADNQWFIKNTIHYSLPEEIYDYVI